jgi:hypothetical protein
MPELPITNEDGSLTLDAALTVWAFMAHPRSEEFRRQFLSRMYERAAATIQPQLEVEAPTDAGLMGAVVGWHLGEWLQPFGGFQQLTRAPSASDTYQRLLSSFWPGSVAGDLLVYMHRMKVSGVKPSVNKAIAIAVDYLKRATTPNGAPGPGKSDRYVRDQWTEYKPVAHLWAAYREMFANRQGGNLPEMTWEEGFPLFLAFSEWFAQEGLSIYPHSRKAPVLDSAELWRVPAKARERWPLLKVEFGPLPGWALEVLRRYKAKKSD